MSVSTSSLLLTSTCCASKEVALSDDQMNKLVENPELVSTAQKVFLRNYLITSTKEVSDKNKSHEDPIIQSCYVKMADIACPTNESIFGRPCSEICRLSSRYQRKINSTLLTRNKSI